MKTENEQLWQDFAQRAALTPTMLEQFKKYYTFLITNNELFNLTAITDLRSVIAYHFEDSLVLNDLIFLKDVKAIADIGSGAGFPGIPLKIRFPHLYVTLIEVSQKKVQFLWEVIEILQLEGAAVNSLDWRTFLRKTDEPIDVFCARASLQPDELLRMFKPSSPYHNKKLVYWASDQWISQEEEKEYLQKELFYKMRTKKRKLALFEKKS